MQNALIVMLLKTTKYGNAYNGWLMTLGNVIYRNVYLKSFSTFEWFNKIVKLVFRWILFLWLLFSVKKRKKGKKKEKKRRMRDVSRNEAQERQNKIDEKWSQ